MHLTHDSGLGRALQKFHPLSGKRVALVDADGLNLERLTDLGEAFSLAGAEIVLIGPSAELRDSEGRSTVQTDLTFDCAAPEFYDALCIPGSADAVAVLRRSDVARDFVRHFARNGKWIATLDYGALLLESFGLLAGRTVAADPALRAGLEAAGAAWVKDAVIADQRLVTAEGDAQLEAFVRVATFGFSETHAAETGYH